MIEGIDIKMVALDLDGTTLNHNKEISMRTVKAFRDLAERKKHIVIATGRTFNSLPEQLFEIDGLEYVITSNGAHITRLADKKCIYESYISPKSVEEIGKIMSQTDYSVEVVVGGKAFMSKTEFETMEEEGSSFRDVEYVIATRNPVDNIYAFMLENKDGIENISINFPEERDREKVRKLLSNVDDITVTNSFSYNFEIGGAKTSKGEALKHLMDVVGIGREELMACGDSPNDSEMIKLARVGVVMDNADNGLKEIADFVTASNNEEGVAKAIEKFVL